MEEEKGACYGLGTESGPPHNIRRPDDERRRMCLFSEPENVNYVEGES